ncbi:hypothetical protein JIO03_09435 [Limosilactobacillus fermentum]|nr:hypothetical protein JIO03_09435 [Limosilactobacillus fermentum]
MKGKKMSQPIGAPERLVIIGNGFDLKCGLHSTFGEYIKQVLKTQDPNNFSLAICQMLIKRY